MEEKLEIVLLGLKREASVVELCRRHGVTETIYYRWRSHFLEAGREALPSNGKADPSRRERQLEQENEDFRTALGKLMLQNRLLRRLKNVGR